MRRRKFIATSTGILGLSSIAGKIGTQPAIGVDFRIPSKLTESQVTSNNIVITLSNITIQASNISDTDSDIILELKSRTSANGDKFTTIDDYSYSLDSENETIKISSLSVDLGSKSNLDYSNASTAELKLVINHPDIGSKYTTERFIIPDNIVQNDLVGWWPLHEWYGQSNDLSSNNNHATLENITRKSLGVSSVTSYYFNGSNSTVTYPTYSYGTEDNFSLSFWFRPDFDEDSRNITSEGTWNNFVGIKNNAFRWWHEDHGSVTTPVSSIQKGNWYHGVITYDSEGRKIWLNGDLEDQDSITETFSWSNIGKDGGWGYWKGQVSDFRIYNKSLSETEIQKLYDWGSGDYTRSSLHNGSDSGSISRWTFNQVLNDYWNGNDGSATTTSYKNGIQQEALDTKNSGDVVVSDDESLDISNEMTISAWIYNNKLPVNMTDNFPLIWRKPNGGDNGSITLGILTSDTNEFGIRISSGDSSENPDARYVIDKTGWIHITGTYNKKKLKLYVNGVNVATKKTSIPINTNSIDATIGSGWEGRIDDMRIYDRELNKNEVYQLYRWGSGGQDIREQTTTINKSDLIGWWKLNETDGNVAYDSSGNSNTGNIYGAGPVETGTSPDPIGESSYKFDGDNDYVDVTPSNSLSDPITVTGWYKPATTDRCAVVGGHENSVKRLILGVNGDGVSAAGQATYGLYSGGWYVATGPELKTDTWYHLAGVTKNGINYLYVNGEMVDSVSTSSTSFPSLFIGAVDSQVRNLANGNISGIRVYDRSLTPQEILYLYEQKF